MPKKWSKKYKRSIDCNNPKGFSQKAHCAGRKKKESKMSSKLEELVGKSITEEQFDEAAGKKDKCYYKVKARYDVWPSAYASGALVKCRKVGAANWGKSKKEGIEEKMRPAIKKALAQKGYGPIFNAIDTSKQQLKQLRYSRGEIQDTLIDMFGDEDPKILKKIKEGKVLNKEGLDDLKALPKDLKKSIKKNREESVNEAPMELNKIKDAIKMFQKKIEKQGRVTNARDEEHLKNLIKLYIQMGGKGIKEGFASDAQRRAAFASGYKAKGKKKKKKEGVNETTYKFKGYTASKMDELDAMLSRAGIKGTPNFNDMTYSVNKKSSKIDRIMKMKGGKKIKPIRLRGKSGMGKISHLGMESVDEARGTCWVGYQQKGMKKKGDRMVPNCVKEIYWESGLGESCGYTFELEPIEEAEYQGRKVKLNKIMQGDQKKFKVYVKNPKGNVVKVNFGQGGDAKGGTMRIRKSNPAARKSFRARHNCDNPGPKHKARYWSCRKW